MSEFLYYYHPVEPATWFYLSSLLTIGLFFKFSRFWSVRNLDLLLLIGLGPGLLFIHYGHKADRTARAVLRGESVPADVAVVSPAVVVPQATENADASEEASGADAERTPEAGPATVDPAAASPVAGDAAPNDLVPESAEGSTTTDAEPAAARELASSRPAEAATDAAAEETGTAAGDSSAPVEALDPAATAAADLIARGRRLQFYGYIWLFCGGFLLLGRLLADPTMVRRPLLEPNLSAGGLTFIGCSLFVFLMADVISRPAEHRAHAEPSQAMDESVATGVPAKTSGGPEYAVLSHLTINASKALAIAAHLTIVVGLVLVGYWHFDNIIMGVGAATLYLMLPYTALMTNEFKHALPSAALVWAVLCYRKPLVSGALIGFAGGVAYYPLFLLPLWCSFYWARGLVRFVCGLVVMLAVLLIVLSGAPEFLENVRLMFGLMPPAMEDLRGIWDPGLGGWNGYYRLPVLAAFLVLVASMTLWPAQKNLGTLLSCSAAIMLATQFWHGFGGGTFMAWYLPLLLLTVFRPNLEDRVALTVLTERWLPRRASANRPDRATQAV